MRGLQRLDQHVVDEGLRRAPRELAVERHDTSSVDADAREQLGLALERGEQPRRRSGATTDCGCGSNVRTVSAPLDDLAVAEVDPVEGAHRHPAGAVRRRAAG